MNMSDLIKQTSDKGGLRTGADLGAVTDSC